MKNLLVMGVASVVLLSGWSLRADVIPTTLPTAPIVTGDDPPITYTEQATVSGSLGGSAFTNKLITVVFSGDTGTVTGGSGFFTNSVGTTTFTIAGVGSGTFTDSMFVFDNQGALFAGIADSAGSLLDTQNAAFASYNLTTPIGPLSGSPFIRPDLTFGTTAGGLIISSSGNSTFTASTVPEPASVFLLGGVGAIFAARLKRKAAVLRSRASEFRSIG
jgi:hypothetical protein